MSPFRAHTFIYPSLTIEEERDKHIEIGLFSNFLLGRDIEELRECTNRERVGDRILLHHISLCAWTTECTSAKASATTTPRTTLTRGCLLCTTLGRSSLTTRSALRLRHINMVRSEVAIECHD